MRAHSAAAMLILGLTGATASAGAQPLTRADGNVGAKGMRGDRVQAPQWGGRIDGRWWAGSRAPGGWSAYHRPLRGSTLPAFWAAPQFRIANWSAFDLPSPTDGYVWSRYYDDAVLIDDRGVVHDTIGGVDWDQFDPAGTDYAYREDWYGRASASSVAAPAAGRPGAPYAPPSRRARDVTRAGSAIDGRPSEVTVARVSPPALAVDDRVAFTRAPIAPRPPAPVAERPGADYPPPGAVPPPHAGAVHPPPPRSAALPARPGAGYPPPPPAGAALPPPHLAGYPPAVAVRALPPVPDYAPGADYPPGMPAPGVAPAPIVTATNGARVVTTTTPATSQGYYANGYYYPPPSIVTVTVTSQPAPAAQPAERWEEEVSYSSGRRRRR